MLFLPVILNEVKNLGSVFSVFRALGNSPLKPDLFVPSPLSSVAMVAGHKPGEAVAMLQANGIRVEGNDQSIAEISRIMIP
jgi:hypothetical protein